MIYERFHWPHSILPARDLGMEIAVELIQIFVTPNCDCGVNIFAAAGFETSFVLRLL